MKDLLPAFFEHARDALPEEACGMVVLAEGEHRYVRCRNAAIHPCRDFLIDARDEDAARDLGDPVFIVHSHPYTPPAPSDADLAGIENTRLPWIIVNHEGAYTITEPSGYKQPLLGREFRHFTSDCYSLIRDYFAEHDIVLPNYPRTQDWWRNGGDMYRQHFEEAGFVRVDGEPRLHDVLLMNLRSTVPNHGAIYVGDGKILHHLEGQLSAVMLYEGLWRRAVNLVIRHQRFA